MGCPISRVICKKCEFWLCLYRLSSAVVLDRRSAVPARSPPRRPRRSSKADLASVARSANFGCVSIGLLLLSSLIAAAQSPQDLLAAGRVDQAIQTIDQQIHTTPTAQNYNLLCRAHFELGAWDAGIPACEKATALEPDNGLYHLWLGRLYGAK